MSYLEPPPMPAPVIVMKDVGGLVADYQRQTAIYRASEREVRLHECRSACTLALSLPNVCVYPDSTLKFHFAYDPRNHQTNLGVSQQLFDSYPAAVRARLGPLTRKYKVLSGSELIELGIRGCNEPKTNQPKTNQPRIMVASAAAGKPPLAAQPGPEKPLLAGLMDKMLSVFGAGEAAGALQRRPAPGPAPARIPLAEAPLPPVRPAELAQPGSVAATQAPADTPVQLAAAPFAGKLAAERRPTRPALPIIITGAQPILPPGFRAYAGLDQ
ncbi:MAG TPA: hypothetical protein VHT02_06540 [Methylocella sp.]|nr:hypothetical protein [Methylocella sp.]